MEYLDGETLAQRLEKGALPLDQALQVAIEIADALDKAHRQGITHRDLKPGNIMLTKTGAKLLDFELAKLKGPEHAAGPTALTTQDAPLTQQGAILGTVPYMAPEQLEGKEADDRADIFAFGVLLLTRPVLAPAAVQNMWQLLMAPRVAAPLLLVALVMSLGGFWLWNRGADARWAREEAVPEIMRFIEEDDYLAAFELAEEAERHIPEDPILADLWPQMSAMGSLDAEPGGGPCVHQALWSQ